MTEYLLSYDSIPLSYDSISTSYDGIPCIPFRLRSVKALTY